MVFSDHGMCNADEYINIEDLFRKYFSRNSIEYIVDATLTFIRINKNHHNTKDSLIKILERKLRDKVLVFDVEIHHDELKTPWSIL